MLPTKKGIAIVQKIKKERKEKRQTKEAQGVISIFLLTERGKS